RRGDHPSHDRNAIAAAPRPGPRKGSAMRISVPAEVKNNEYRVALTPAGVHDLVVQGHEVTAQSGAGAGSSMTDAEYRDAGALIVADAAGDWAGAWLVLQAKEPIEGEYGRFRNDLVLCTSLHLAADRPPPDALTRSGHRLRDGAAARRRATAARTDERGRRPAGADRRSVHADAVRRRARTPDVRRSRNAPRARRGHRRRSGRRERRRHRGWHGRRCHG